MKAKTIGILLILIIIVALGFFVIKGVTQSVIAKTFTPVFCNDYEFTCCVETKTAGNQQIGTTINFKCPDSATKCEVLSSSDSVAHLYTGSINCRITRELSNLYIPLYKCDDGKEVSKSYPIQVPKGNIFWADRNTNIAYIIYGQKLVFTGRASGTIGVDLSSDSCAYTINKGTIYTPNGQNTGTTSYTVPVSSCILSWQTGDRHICGSLEEQCSADTDCTSHTYGNKECNARTLQTYGCKQLPLPSGVTKDADGNLSGGNSLINNPLSYSGIISRCEVISNQQVQCCGDTDCGSSLFCDKTTFTCKPQVQCKQNSDCGVSTQCDYVNLKLKTPICSNNQCSYSTQNVECCNDNNCDINSYCDINHKCKLKEVNVTQCPFSCCVGEAKYTERKCPTNQYCKDHTCTSEKVCTSDANCLPTQTCKDGECVDKQLVCTGQLFGIVSANIGTKEQCGFWCQIGITKPTPINVCVYDYSMVYIMLGLLTLIVVLVIFIASRGKKKGKKGFKLGSKTTRNILLIMGALALAVVILAFFKFVFWLVFTIILLALAGAVIWVIMKFKKIM